jgi:hypothetical protein
MLAGAALSAGSVDFAEFIQFGGCELGEPLHLVGELKGIVERSEAVAEDIEHVRNHLVPSSARG